MANELKVSQVATEAIGDSSVTPILSVSQVMTEAIGAPTASTGLSVSQVIVEVLGSSGSDPIDPDFGVPTEVGPVDDERLRFRGLFLCTCWKVIDKNDDVYAFTDHDKRMTVGGVVYSPLHAWRSEARQARVGLEGDNSTLEGPIRSAGISIDKCRLGLFRGAQVFEYLVDWRCPWRGPILTSIYFVQEQTFDQEKFKFQLESTEARAQQKVGMTLTRNCRHDLGDSECQYAFVGTDTETGRAVQSLVSSVEFVANFVTHAADSHYTNGKLTWTLGGNTGLVQDVKLHANQNITLWIPPPVPIQAADQFTIRVGCDKLLTTCSDKFDNNVNFGGFVTIPGRDRAINNQKLLSEAAAKKS